MFHPCSLSVGGFCAERPQTSLPGPLSPSVRLPCRFAGSMGASPPSVSPVHTPTGPSCLLDPPWAHNHCPHPTQVSLRANDTPDPSLARPCLQPQTRCSHPSPRLPFCITPLVGSSIFPRMQARILGITFDLDSLSHQPHSVHPETSLKLYLQNISRICPFCPLLCLHPAPAYPTQPWSLAPTITLTACPHDIHQRAQVSA